MRITAFTIALILAIGVRAQTTFNIKPKPPQGMWLLVEDSTACGEKSPFPVERIFFGENHRFRVFLKDGSQASTTYEWKDGKIELFGITQNGEVKRSDQYLKVTIVNRELLSIAVTDECGVGWVNYLPQEKMKF